MTKFVRAFFLSDDGDDTSNVLIDLLLGEDRKVISRVPLFGFWGKLNSTEVWPFIYQNGTLDTGDQHDPADPESTPCPPADRYISFDIDDRIIALNEGYLLRYGGETWRLVLEKITDIASL